jgi:putative ABC transport system ATP-binding protein
MMTPSIIIADEPTANIDGATATSLLDLMAELNRKEHVTFIMASHDQRVVKYATRVVEMADGVIKNDNHPAVGETSA